MIGQSVRRRDGEAKVRGQAVYTIDYEEPRMLHAKLLRAHVAARIVRLDMSAAEAMPGVHAVSAVELELEPLEALTELEAALAPAARLIHPDWESYSSIAPGERNGNVAWEAHLERGDLEAAFARADLVVEDEFVAHRQHQCPIEPHACVARYGAKGAAEPPIVPVAGAIANAVSDAVGGPFNRLPITPFDVLAALREETPA